MIIKDEHATARARQIGLRYAIRDGAGKAYGFYATRDEAMDRTRLHQRKLDVEGVKARLRVVAL